MLFAVGTAAFTDGLVVTLAAGWATEDVVLLLAEVGCVVTFVAGFAGLVFGAVVLLRVFSAAFGADVDRAEVVALIAGLAVGLTVSLLGDCFTEVLSGAFMAGLDVDFTVADFGAAGVTTGFGVVLTAGFGAADLTVGLFTLGVGDAIGVLLSN